MSRRLSTPALYVMATRENVGKTTVSLTIYDILRKHYENVGYMKPIGQRHVNVGQSIVDKDAALFHEYFDMQHRIADVSPVIFTRGLTRRVVDAFLASDEAPDRLADRVESAFHRIESTSSAVVVEGSGHTAVGSLCGISNADVAGRLGVPCLFVVNGGIGKAFDEVALNKALLDAQRVPLCGVIMNKVRPDHLAEVRDYVNRALRAAWGVELLGCVPDLSDLALPTMQSLSASLGGDLVATPEQRLMSFCPESMKVISSDTELFLSYLYARMYMGCLLFVCRDRLALLLAIIEAARHNFFNGGVVLTGPTSIPVHHTVLASLREVGVPFISCSLQTIDALEQVRSDVYKLNAADPSRISKAIAHYSKHIDVDRLLSVFEQSSQRPRTVAPAHGALCRPAMFPSEPSSSTPGGGDDAPCPAT
eukprot:TRINITY_DN2398_c0_g1_i1.p1 TRINITY_DN2398_c0_g1~~TRINITY_DN2398_c0_g1_i1.p1  ORF type:complete len:422 (-),score=49.67 TRINITY_DN2398_c0_g1_i1:1238-2503(-)